MESVCRICLNIKTFFPGDHCPFFLMKIIQIFIESNRIQVQLVKVHYKIQILYMLTLGRTRWGGKVFLEVFQNELSSRLAPFSVAVRLSLRHILT